MSRIFMEFCAQEKGPSACIVFPHGRAGRNNVSGKNCLIWAEHDNDNVLISNNINNAPLLGRAIVAANHRTAGPVQSSHVAKLLKDENARVCLICPEGGLYKGALAACL